MTAAAGGPPTFLGTPVGLRDVEAELRRQLRGEAEAEHAPAQRVCMSNLILYCGGPEQAAAVAEQVPDVVAVHPARVLLLVPDPSVESLTAGVNVRCRLLGSHQRACCEQVTLLAPPAQADRLPFTVRSLVIGDLPTNLWWAAPVPPPLSGALLLELAENATQILYDSIGWPQPAVGVVATAAWLDEVERTDARWRVASDLNWRRLKYWRRLAAQALDPASAPGAADSATELLVEHGPHAVIQAWLLASWLSTRLGWKLRGGRSKDGTEMAWQFAGPRGDVRVRVKRLDQGPPEVRRARVACTLEGRAAALNLTAEGQRLVITPEGVPGEPRTITLPPHLVAELIGRQLSDRERDPVFRETMHAARDMARSVLAG
jgi:glucose-6-phosphate dehydrogenase assembly protein OpcA